MNWAFSFNNMCACVKYLQLAWLTKYYSKSILLLFLFFPFPSFPFIC